MIAHGERGRYLLGCPCKLCRAANTDYQRRLRARRKERSTKPADTQQ